MRIRFWGVRGSIPCPGPSTVKYGGNTVCLELQFPEVNRLIIIDAGSGIRELGNHLLSPQRRKGPLITDIYLTHTHWDHIMGLPFFTPAYLPDTRLQIFGPVSYEEGSLEAIVGGQMTYRYFPVRECELAADIRYFTLKEENRIDLGDGIQLTTKYLNHPVLCLGYRFEYRGKSLCTAYDTEPFRNVFITDPAHPSYDEAMAEEGERVAQDQNLLVENFYAGADLLIHDTQFTEPEYHASRVGWGHSSVEAAIRAARRVGVKKLALFHHDPLRTDSDLDRLADLYCGPAGPGQPEIFFAREGQEIVL